MSFLSLFSILAKSLRSPKPAHRRGGRPARFRPELEQLEDRRLPSAAPVLMVIGNQDFYYKEYHDTRQALEQAGLHVTVAAATTAIAVPHDNSGQGADGGLVQPDIAITNAHASDYSTIVFIGGWGASSYQYAFPGSYDNAAYNSSTTVKSAANALISDFVHQGKYVNAICHGVSVLAWSRVDGQSLLAGRTVTTYEGSSPSFMLGGVDQAPPSSWNDTTNGATVLAPMSIGDPTTAADDVHVDATSRIITAENWDSATMFGQTIAQQLQTSSSSPPSPGSPPSASNPVYVAAAYRDVLGRPADPAGLASWTAALNSGLSRATFANALTHSPEYFSDFVTAAYNRYLGRSPDAPGLAHWVAAMQSGLTDERLEAGFIGSAEYIANHGGAGAGWVRGMYQDLLGRTPAQTEVDGWVQALADGMASTQVAYGFAASPERETMRVTTDYQTFLGRTPDAGGLASWVNGFVSGSLRNEDVVAGFVASDEYFSKHSS